MRSHSPPDLSGLSRLPAELLAACMHYLEGLNLRGGAAIVGVRTTDEFVLVYYQSEQYYRSRDLGDAVAGNLPLFIDTHKKAGYLKPFRTQFDECVRAARDGRIDSLLTRVI